MCNFNQSSVPKGWQWVCLKISGGCPQDSQNCSAFSSPNGRSFNSLEKVHEFNRQLEKAKLEKENRRLLADSLRQESKVNNVKVNNSSMIVCNYCDLAFFNQSMQKKHERDIHSNYGSSRMIKCEHCNESFAIMAHLQAHMREFHMSIPVPCKFCRKMFLSMDRYEEHIKMFHMKSSSSSGQYEPLNLSKREVPKSSFQYNAREIEDRMHEIVNKNKNASSFQYNPREVDDRMHEIVNKNKNARQQLKMLKESKVSNLFPTGISVSGPSLKNLNPNLGNIQLDKSNIYRSEAESRMANFRELSFSKKQKYQPLVPQIMEQKANFQTSLNVSNLPQENNLPSLWKQSTEPRKHIFPQENSLPSLWKQSAEPRKQISPEAMIERLKAEYNQLHPDQTKDLYTKSLLRPAPFRKPAPISGEEMLQAMNSKSLRRKDIALPIRRASYKMPPPPTKSRTRKPMKRKEPYDPSIPGKNQITVSQTCKYMGLKDYPVPINENNKHFFKNRANFEDYYTPLVASVNLGGNPLSIQTLVKAKWFEVMQAKLGDSGSIYFNKPRRNKVKIQVSL
eukprot:GFUD01039407.1.p1 GENE.GFUD01039407.1~~GFUD01039407.1.p1  ORF type:complete len:564 (+),score=104.47 GFUD01039407.1:133-1824(+)